MKKTKILHLTFDMRIGGTEQVIRNLISGLDPQRFESSIACTDGKIGPWGLELQDAGIKIFKFDRQSGLDFQLIKALRRKIKSEKIDLVHCHQYTPYTYGCFATMLTGIPVIFTEHGRFYPDFSTTKRRVMNPILELFTNKITSISKATKGALIEFENFKEKNIEVIYNGIKDLAGKEIDQTSDFIDQIQAFKNSQGIILGTISRLDPIKNQEMMIKAFGKALKASSNMKLLIVGDGPDREKLENLVDEQDLSKDVMFTGFQTNPQDYLQMMDVFLLPSLSEGTSMTLLEAMSFSKPSIVTRVGGNPEIIEDNVSGLITENKNEQQLVEAIKTLASNEGLRDKLGAQAREVYLEKFTLSKMCDDYANLYQDLTG